MVPFLLGPDIFFSFWEGSDADVCTLCKNAQLCIYCLLIVDLYMKEMIILCGYVCVFIYIYIYTYIHMYIYIYMYDIHIYTYTFIYVCICINIDTYSTMSLFLKRSLGVLKAPCGVHGHLPSSILAGLSVFVL